jgi:hypothetical protein
LFLICFLPLEAYGQVDRGLLVGWNRSDWDHQPTGTAADVFTPKDGFCVGGYLRGSMSGHLGWRWEIMYTRKGALQEAAGTDENGNPTGEIKFYHNVAYLELPLLLTWTVPIRGIVRPVFFLGPGLDFQLSAKVQAAYPSGVKNSFNADEDLDTANATDFSLIFGGGVDIDAGGRVINLQVRYVSGTLAVFQTAKNRTLSVMAGFGI